MSMRYCTACGGRYPLATGSCPLDGEALQELPDPLHGATLGGRYRVLDTLGSGGMATVYRARPEPAGKGDRDVAIKVLSPDLAWEPLQRARFVREARATHRVRHPHIVAVLDYGQDADRAWLVMEYLAGETLADRLLRGPLTPVEAVTVVTQVAQALAHAHDMAIVHRDIKPENIIVCAAVPGIHVKVLDFGLAHVRDEVRLTVSGTLFGTPEYMSPEMARGEACSNASDLYALGVTFFEMLTGRRPFDGTAAELIEQHRDQSPPALRAFSDTLPACLDPVVQRLLAKDPSERYRDGRHIVDDLTALLPSLPAEPVQGPREGLQAPAAVAVSLDPWAARVAALHATVAAAWPDHGVPRDVMALLQRMDAALETARAETRAMKHLARALARCEAQALATRERIVAALTALAQDESVTLRTLDALARRRAEVRGKGDHAMALLLRAWSQAQSQSVSEAGDETPSRAWESLREQEEAVVAEMVIHRQTAARLAFQVSQLRGHLAGADAASDRDEASLRAELEAHGAARTAAMETLATLCALLSQPVWPTASTPRADTLARHGTGRDDGA